MILTDPNQDDNPIAFANKAFLDLTGYEEAEVLGRNCRFLQGSQTDRGAVAELREAIEARQSIALELLNYRRDGSPFWNAVFIGPVYDVEGNLSISSPASSTSRAAATSNKAIARRRRWNRSASSPPASRTISTICCRW